MYEKINRNSLGQYNYRREKYTWVSVRPNGFFVEGTRDPNVLKRMRAHKSGESWTGRFSRALERGDVT